MLSRDGVVALLSSHIKEVHKTAQAAADHWGVSPTFISKVLKGFKPPNKKMLSDLGYQKVTVYVPEQRAAELEPAGADCLGTALTMSDD